MNKKKRYIRAGIILSFLFIIFSFQTVYANRTINDSAGFLDTVADNAGVSKDNIPTVSGQIIKNFLTLAGLIFFILVVYAGIRWMLAQGKEDGIDGARRTIVFASIGIVVIAGSYALTNFVTEKVINRSSEEESATVSQAKDVDISDPNSLGCCFDKVRHPNSDFFPEFRATTWQWRVTSYDDCELQGITASSFDMLHGKNYWKFEKDVSTKKECGELHAQFCKEIDCYELEF